jgi:[acyl-carrier-protein] S-malonyltransferase
MAAALEEVDLRAPAVPLVSNVRAEAVTDPDEIRRLLVEQVTGTVRWRESVAWMTGRGVGELWEIGAGKALSGMARRIDRSLASRTVGTAEEVRAAAAAALS